MSEEEKPRQRTVVDGKVMRTSITAMQTADRCVRRWWFKYVERLPEPPKTSLDIGAAGHRRLKHFLDTGEYVLAPMERIGVTRGFVARPVLAAEFELRPEVLSVEGIPLHGSIDAFSLDATGCVHITDWKFKKDLEKWATPGDFLRDPSKPEGIQMLGYAAYLAKHVAKRPALDKIGVTLQDAHAVRLRHVSFLTKGVPDVKETAAKIISLDEAQSLFMEAAARIAPVMKAAAAATCREDVPKNLNACNDYGGCPFKATCLGSKDALRVLFNKEAGKPNTVKTQEKGDTMFDELDDLPPAPKPVAQPILPGLVQVLPPDAPKSDPKLAAKHDEPPKPSTPQTAEQMVEVLEASIAAVAPATQDEMPAAGKKKSGRKPKAAQEELPTSDTKGLHLYFNCMPLGVSTLTLNAYVESLDEQLRQAAQLTCGDIRTTTAQDFSFGKWRGYMAKLAVAHPPAPGHYVVTHGDERVEVVAEALTTLAALVVMGRG